MENITEYIYSVIYIISIVTKKEKKIYTIFFNSNSHHNNQK